MTGMLGNTEGLKKSFIHRMERLYRRRVRDGLVSYELAEELCELSLEAKREITMLMDFQGRVELVVVQDAETLDQLPNIEVPSPQSGLSSRYCVSTHLGWHPPTLGDQVTTLQFHFPVMAVLMAGVKEHYSERFGEHPSFCDGAYLLSPVMERSEENGRQWLLKCQETGPMTARQLERELLENWIAWGEPVYERGAHRHGDRERALLMGLYGGGKEAESSLDDMLDELRQLAKTAGAQVLDVAKQSRSHPDPKTYIGSGKAQELAFRVQQLGADVVIADDELSPVQQSNLERILRTKVIDRTELILDIFAQRARSREGKIQVELAQLQYQMPRLKGRGRVFSQQTSVGAKGGIATRGPGETKLETDRRLLRQRVTVLEQQAEEVVRHRQFQKQSRYQAGIPTVALVGYTNAGKSTLMHALTKADVVREDKLFATLDPTVRKLVLPDGKRALLSDTVGFIRKLPTFLIKAFQATLEEVATADLIWHVWDISHPDRVEHWHAVQEVLAQVWDQDGQMLPPIWTLCNKIDNLENPERELEAAASLVPKPIAISALTGAGIPALLAELGDFIETDYNPGLIESPVESD